jgi:hypothetical protein
MSIPASSLSVKVTLDIERTLTFDNRAEFRMGSLDRPFAISDLNNRKRSWAAVVAWTWACLSKKDARDFKEPEDLVDILQDADKALAVAKAIIESWEAAQPPKTKG